MNKTALFKNPALIFAIFVVAICALIFPASVPSVHADGAPPPEPDMGGLAPYHPIKTNVQMTSETVLIDVLTHPTHWIPNDEYLMDWNQVKVTASFTLRNQGKVEEKMQVIFPLTRLDYPWLTSSYSIIGSSFVAMVNGKRVPTTQLSTPPELQAFPQGLDSSLPDGLFLPDVGWAGFDVTFPVQEDVIVQVEYLMRGYITDGLHHVDYILETGAGWYGRILSGDIILRLPYPATRESVPETPTGCIFAGNEVQCQRKNFEPKRKDNLSFSFIDINEWSPALELRSRVEQYPDDAAAWYRLADRYYGLGLGWGESISNQHMVDLAIQAYENAVALRPDWGDAHFHLARALWYNNPNVIRGIGNIPQRDLVVGDPAVQRILQEWKLAASYGVINYDDNFARLMFSAFPELETPLPVITQSTSISAIPVVTPVPISGTRQKTIAMSAGNDRTCVLTAGGEVKCRGMYPNLNTDVIGDFTAVAAGDGYTCILTTNGGVQCLGRNNFGQLGDGTTSDRVAPVDVLGLTEGVSALVAGGNHTCALMASGGVKCWGRNYFGQLGNGTMAYSLVPVDVKGLSSGVAKLVAGSDHTCALIKAGGIKCWGANEAGQLGDGSLIHRLEPVNILGLPNDIIALAAGFAHTCALNSQGLVMCWGDNSHGQLGDGNTAPHMEPMTVPGLDSNITKVVAGDGYTCALTSLGGVKCWGKVDFHADNYNGITTIDRYTPADVDGLTSGVVDLAAGNDHTCALVQNSVIKCWGITRFGSDMFATSGFGYRQTPVDAIELCIQPVLLPSPTPISTPESASYTPVSPATAIPRETSSPPTDLIWDLILLIAVASLILILRWSRARGHHT